MKNKYTRRRFFRAAALGGAGFAILKDSRSARGAPLNTQLNIAVIGCAGRGAGYVGEKGTCCAVVNDGHRVAAMCDVDVKRAGEAFGRWPDAIKGHDYRIMFEKYNDAFDAVIVSTGDYGHAPASAAALRAGKHVYCEKPLTVAVKESRMLGQLAAERPALMTQMGNQGGYSRKAVNMVWGGLLGEVREVHAWCCMSGTGRRPLPAGYHPTPSTLKWDLWLGPSPYRDYHPEWLRYLMWREFGTSLLGNRGSHSMATIFKALKLGALWPPAAKKDTPPAQRPIIKVTGECSELCLYSFPKWEKVRWNVPARDDMGPVTIYWYSGDYMLQGMRQTWEEMLGRRLDLGGPGEKWTDWLNSIIVGDKGRLYCDGMAALIAALPKEKFEGVEPPELLPPTVGGPGLRGWFEAIIKGTTKPMSCFDDFSGPYIEFQNLAHVATLFPGEELEFDPIDCRIVNNSMADRALRREYRSGWDMELAM